MGLGMALRGRFTKGRSSVAFGTVINVLLQPRKNYRMVITDLWVIAAGTAHTLTCLRPITAPVALTAAVTAGASYVLPVSLDPGSAAGLNAGIPGGTGLVSQLPTNIAAAGDYVVTLLPDGTYYMDTIASVATLNWTMTGTLPTNGAASAAPAWWLGVTGDKDAYTAEVHPVLTVTLSTINKWNDNECGVLASNRVYEPMILQDNNASATGTIEWVSGGFVRE